MATAEQIQLLPEVEAFISQGLIGAWIDGRAREGSDGTFTTLNPVSYTHLTLPTIRLV